MNARPIRLVVFSQLPFPRVHAQHASKSLTHDHPPGLQMYCDAAPKPVHCRTSATRCHRRYRAPRGRRGRSLVRGWRSPGPPASQRFEALWNGLSGGRLACADGGAVQSQGDWSVLRAVPLSGNSGSCLDACSRANLWRAFACRIVPVMSGALAFGLVAPDLSPVPATRPGSGCGVLLRRLYGRNGSAQHFWLS